ncbi:alanine racemase [Agreia sp. COWG]|uniref:alanine racemase n=1 Tax=Agreia sp. COWG TaxID=2773266 RepID=UPI001926026D|nr:alanine racemase [Agreia sp. COWG]CAD6004309.1 Alanine racemase [Agreia sp. COWG]
MTDNGPDSQAIIDLAAVRSNVAALIEAAGGSAVMTVVKANGYGHGATQVAAAAVEAGASWLGVADVDEGLELRASGVQAPVLAWLHVPGTRFDEAIGAGLDIAVSDGAQLQSVADSVQRIGRAGVRAQVHIKVDTGLGRNGAGESTWARLFASAATLERAGVLRVRGLFSHLGNASDDEDELQLSRYERALATASGEGVRPQLRHLASTAAALRHPDMRLDLVRTGIGTYGLSPFGGGEAELNDSMPSLVPVMSLRSRVVAVVPSLDGDGSARSGIVPLGYGDGIPPQAAGSVRVSSAGDLLLVTRIESDHLFVEPLSADGDVARGDIVTLFGDPSHGFTSVDEWAAAAQTINYEIVTRLGAAVERRFSS